MLWICLFILYDISFEDKKVMKFRYTEKLGLHMINEFSGSVTTYYIQFFKVMG
jgi:hypothetical protein